jgi:protein-tyrosine phosphatase
MTATLAPMRISVVCLGNICRSPLAEAALRHELTAVGLGERVTVDSAGTGDWNVGKPPDRRMRAAATRTGLALGGTARQIAAADLADSDLILVMDRQNLADVLALAPDAATRDKVHLYLDYAGAGGEVPDPYYGGDEGFTEVVAMVREAARTITQRLADQMASA